MSFDIIAVESELNVLANNFEVLVVYLKEQSTQE